MNITTHKEIDERGSAIVEMVLAIPILILLVCAVLDVSTYIKAGITADTAATTAVRYVMDDPSKTESDIKAYLTRVDPSLSDSNCEVTVQFGGNNTEMYTHYFYDEEKDNPIPRPNSTVTLRPVAVSVTYTGSFYTPLGRLIGYATGNDGSLVATSTQVGELDLTGGATW